MTQNQRQLTASILSPCLNIHAEITNEFAEKKTANASDRYQIAPALKALKNLNIKTKIFSLNKIYEIPEVDAIPEDSALCIASKMRSHPTLNDPNKYAQFHLYTALTAKRNGAKLVTFYSDNVIANGAYDAELYKNLLYFSDCIITPTRQMSSYAKRWGGENTKIKCIKDPILVKKQPFLRINNFNKICNIIWFGHNQNFFYLESILPDLILKSPENYTFELTILTTRDSLYRFKKITYPPLQKKSNWRFRLVPWQLDNQPKQLENELGRAHITLLPSDPNDPKKRGASHNRLTDSIQSGCIPLASPLPSYTELSKISLIGSDFSNLLNLALSKNEQICEKYNFIRDHLLQEFTIAKNLASWEKAFTEILAD